MQTLRKSGVVVAYTVKAFFTVELLSELDIMITKVLQALKLRLSLIGQIVSLYKILVELCHHYVL